MPSTSRVKAFFADITRPLESTVLPFEMKIASLAIRIDIYIYIYIILPLAIAHAH